MKKSNSTPNPTQRTLLDPTTELAQSFRIKPEPQILEWWQLRYNEKLQEAIDTPNANVVLMGDSIIQQWEETELDLWEENPLGYRQLNLGFSGDSAENLLWRIQNGQLDNTTPEVVILLIGTNNTGLRLDTAGHTAFAIDLILLEIQQRLPKAHIVLMALLPREEFSDHPNRIRNNEINLLIAPFSLRPGISFCDCGHLFLNEDNTLRMDLMEDGIHLSNVAYMMLRDTVSPILEEHLSATD